MGEFITFEGLDGTGKTTQIQRLALELRRRGQVVLLTREPGGTTLGERMRDLLLQNDAAPSAEAELALMCASRAQKVREVIEPALARGEWVLCDRFHDSTEAYQGGGRGLDRDDIRVLHRILCHDLQPRRTIILELDPAVGLERARRRLQRQASGEGRFEAEGEAFLARVEAAYREIAAREPHRCRLVSAAGAIADVAERVWTAVADMVT